MDAARSELAALYLGLRSDVDTCKNNLSDSYTGFWDRAYVRAVFSLVEGVSYSVRQYVISGSESGLFTIDAQVANFMRERAYKLSSSGKIVQSDQEFLKFMPGFKFTYGVLGGCLDMGGFVRSAFSNNGFENFQKGVEIRNRLTHPKMAREMMVRGGELDCVRSAEDWFHALALPLVDAAFNRERDYLLRADA